MSSANGSAWRSTRACVPRYERFVSALLEVTDNGTSAPSPDGNGLRGMRERVDALGGSVQRTSEDGVRLTIALPLTEVK